MDLDESMDAFKKPSNYARKVIKPKSAPKKKVPARGQKRKSSSAKGFVGIKFHDNPCLAGENIEMNAASEDLDNSGEEARPKKMLKVYSSKKEDKPVDINENVDCAQAFVSDDGDFAHSCQTCGKLLRLSDLRIHVPACLRVNFEACRLASESLDNLRSSPRDGMPETGHPNVVEPPSETAAEYFCPTCRSDLSQLSMEQRNLHANRCLDHTECKATSGKNVKKTAPAPQSREKCSLEEHRCLICAKLWKSRAGLKRHLVTCQKKNKFTTMTALTLHRPETGAEVDVEILAEIKRAEEREVNSAGASNAIQRPVKKTIRKRRPKKDPAVFEDGVFQLALAASNGDDLSSNKPKKQKGVLIPVMLTLSPNSKKKELEERVQRMIEQREENNDDDILSTPCLPKSSLAFSSIRAVGFLSGMSNDDKAGISARSDDPGTSARRDTGEQSLPRRDFDQSQYASPAQQVVSPQHVVQPENLERAPSPALLNTYSRPSRVSPAMPHDNELQSPEVSSSNIKNSCLSDASDSPGRCYSDWSLMQRHEREVQCDVSGESEQSETPVTHLRRPSKWTMTSAMPNDSDCRVKGLLSQFETRNPVPSTSTKDAAGEASCKPHNQNEAPSVEIRGESDMNCTLAELEELDNSAQDNVVVSDMKPSQPRHAEVPDHDNSPRDVSWKLAASNQNTSFLSPYEKLIDNPLYSDAKLVLGPEKEMLHVHKMILFCQCPSLLREIDAAGNDTLILPEYSKQDLIPLMQYVYLNKVVPYHTDEKICKESLVKLLSLAHRFNIDFLDQLLSRRGEERKTVIAIHEDEADDLVVQAEEGAELGDDFLSQPSPTQKSTDSRCLSPVLPPNQVQTDEAEIEEDLNSDSDIFELPDSSRCAAVSSSLPTLETSFDSVIGGSAHGIAASLPQVKACMDDVENAEDDITGCDFDMTEIDSMEEKSHPDEDLMPNEPEVSGLTHEVQSGEKFTSLLLEKEERADDGGKANTSCADDSSCTRPSDNWDPAVDEDEISSPLPDLGLNTDELLPSENNSVMSEFELTQSDCALNEVEFDSSQELKSDDGSFSQVPKNKSKTAKEPLSNRQRAIVPRPRHGLRSSSHGSGRKRGGRKKCSLNCCQPDYSVDKYVKEKLPRFKPRERFKKHLSAAKTTHSLQKAEKLVRRRSSSGGRRTPLKSDANKGKRSSSWSKAGQTKSGVQKPELKRQYRQRVKTGVHEKDEQAVDEKIKVGDSIHTTPAESVSLTEMEGKVPDVENMRTKKKFTLPDIPAVTNNSQRSHSGNRKGRKRSGEGYHREETVYVSERLPRFKQREHIRNRPGVANMGKHANKLIKSAKKESLMTKPKNATIRKVAQEEVNQRLSLSQPVQPTVDGSCETTGNQKVTKYTFKRVRAKQLRNYASSTPEKIETAGLPLAAPAKVDSDSDSSYDIAGYGSDGDLYVNIPFDDSFEEKCFIGSACETSDPKGDVFPIVPPAGVNTPVAPAKSTTCYVGPVPITPMLNFKDMETPEVYRHAQKYGLKKTLGKAKLKAKFEEVYMYSHQTVSDAEDDGNVEEFVEAHMSGDADGENQSLDDSDDLTGDMQRWKLELSPLSAKSSSHPKAEKVYSFDTRTIAEVSALSSKVITEMLADMTLLSALLKAKQETGSIKRGSRRDKERCWDIVTPGSSLYDPKVNAILSLPEDYQSAITDPLVNCVVKNYIDYKKYLFDCLPAVCDRMEKELGRT